MKHVTWFMCCVLMIAAPSAWTIQFEDVTSVLSLETTLIELVSSLEDPEYDPTADPRFLLLNGTIASITMIDPDPAYFEAVIELAAGRWTEDEEIELYRGYVSFAGADFASLFSSDSGISIGSQLITIVRPLGTIADPVDGSEVLFLEAYYARSPR